MQANESLVKKFGPKCHLVGIVSTILILTSKLYIKVGMVDVVVLATIGLPIAKNICGTL